MTDFYNNYHDSQCRTQTSISDHSSWKETSWSGVLNHVAYFAVKGCDCFINLVCSRPAPHIMPIFCLCVCVLSGKNQVMDGWCYRLINISTASWLIKAFIVLQTFAFLNSSWECCKLWGLWTCFQLSEVTLRDRDAKCDCRLLLLTYGYSGLAYLMHLCMSPSDILALYFNLYWWTNFGCYFLFCSCNMKMTRQVLQSPDSFTRLFC